MAEESKNEQNNEQQIDVQKYLDVIEKIKNETVSKTEAEKLKAENKKLLDALANGDGLPKKSEKPKYDVEKLRKAYYDTFGSNGNLQPVKAALELRKATIETEGYDPFVANARICHSTGRTPKQEDIESAEKVADMLQYCVDNCNGSDQLFTSLMFECTEDDPTFLRAIAQRNKKNK